ncbi:hypothetical protein Tco_1024410 [Tanacetum coccineum]
MSLYRSRSSGKKCRGSYCLDESLENETLDVDSIVNSIPKNVNNDSVSLLVGSCIMMGVLRIAWKRIWEDEAGEILNATNVPVEDYFWRFFNLEFIMATLKKLSLHNALSRQTKGCVNHFCSFR